MIRRIRFQEICQLGACLMLPIFFSAGLMGQDDGNVKSPSSTLHATHILGFESISKNANGDLSIQDQTLRFQTGEGSSAGVELKSIQDVFLGEEDKETGGTPMTVTRVAAPFGGGRVIGLFAHKKYDTVTLEYLDSDGGLHGAIFQLNKGLGQVLKTELEGRGVHVARAEGETNGLQQAGEKK